MMSKHPNRPEEQFLNKIGVFYLPDNVGITITDPQGYIDRQTLQWVSQTAFCVSEVDQAGKTIKATSVSAFQSAARSKQDIWNDLKQTLVADFNAIPVQQGLVTDLSPKIRPKRPSPAFLNHVGVAAIPHNVDVMIRDNGVDCAKAFIIQKVGNDGNTVSLAEIPARDTRAYTPAIIWQKVGEVLVKEFGAVPLSAPHQSAPSP